MKGKQFILLFIGLLLPICIFIFLKIFGKNEFRVPPLFADALPELPKECGIVSYQLPYHLPDSVLDDLPFQNDTLVCAAFSSDNSVSKNLKTTLEGMPVNIKIYEPAETLHLSQCIFLLKEPFDVALVDRRGVLRGQYKSSDRDELDRLRTEATIILKRF
jgi:hypothetical protein